MRSKGVAKPGASSVSVVGGATPVLWRRRGHVERTLGRLRQRALIRSASEGTRVHHPRLAARRNTGGGARPRRGAVSRATSAPPRRSSVAASGSGCGYCPYEPPEHRPLGRRRGARLPGGASTHAGATRRGGRHGRRRRQPRPRRPRLPVDAAARHHGHHEGSSSCSAARAARGSARTRARTSSARSAPGRASSTSPPGPRTHARRRPGRARRARVRERTPLRRCGLHLVPADREGRTRPLALRHRPAPPVVARGRAPSARLPEPGERLANVVGSRTSRAKLDHGEFGDLSRELGAAAGSVATGLNHSTIPPGKLNCPGLLPLRAGGGLRRARG